MWFPLTIGSAIMLYRVKHGFMLVVLSLGVTASSASRAGTFCDPTLAPTRDSYAYVSRGERCEGLYRRRSSGEPFLIVGFVDGEFKFTPPVDPLAITWRARSGEAVRLRAATYDPEIPYRMDTRRVMADGRFNWPTDVLRGVRLDGSAIAIRAWQIESIGNRQDSVLIPVRLLPSNQQNTNVIIVSTHHLESISLRISEPASGRDIIPPQLIHRGVSSLEITGIPIPRPLPPGRYRVEVGGIPDDGLPFTDAVTVLLH